MMRYRKKNTTNLYKCLESATTISTLLTLLYTLLAGGRGERSYLKSVKIKTKFSKKFWNVSERAILVLSFLVISE